LDFDLMIYIKLKWRLYRYVIDFELYLNSILEMI